MPVAGVSFEWVDESQINSNITPPVVDNIDRPIYMTVFTSDKGPEEWKRKVFGQRFFNLYGTNPSFRKHGQPLLQAAMISNAGGYQTSKRVVAEDSTLANLVLIAQVTKTMVAVLDPSSGNPIWEYTRTSTGGTTYQVVSATKPVKGIAGIPDDAINITQLFQNAADVDFRLQSYSVAGNKINAFVQSARSIYDAAGTPALGSSADYPLMIIADNGRGVSNKRFRIYSDTSNSSPLAYYRYMLEISENGAILETIPFTLNPDINEDEPGKTRPVNRSIETSVFNKSDQVRARFFDDIYWDFIENLEFITQQSDLALKDVIFGYDEYRESIPNLNTNASPLLDSAFGIPLVGGGNGLFGNAPIKLPRPSGNMNVVDIAFRNAFAGNTEDGDMIYDLDANRIDCIFDANYQQPVKRAIEQLANFREDCIFFRDFGTEANTIPQIKQIDSYGSHSRFVASYINYYRIYDPYNRKPIEVTVTYDLAQLFVSHFVNGRIRPFCGQKYGVVIPKEDYIDGSINFIPRNLPGLDQRKVFDDLRLNYINMYDGDVLTMETCYTSQTEYTQLSWLSNVLGVQEVIKAIRVFCPKERYTFLDGDDLVQYKKDVKEMVIDKYAGRFQSISIDYATNAAYDSNKIIYAIIKIKFRNFIQTEKFKIICLQS